MKIMVNGNGNYIVDGSKIIWLSTLMDIHFHELYPLVNIETRGLNEELVLSFCLADTKETWRTGIYNKPLISMDLAKIQDIRLKLNAEIKAAGFDYQEVSIC